MIFYFSGTGNTRWAAEKIALATNDQLVSIPEVIDGDCTFEIRGDSIGFVFPVHGWRPPKLVREFISKLTITTSPSTADSSPQVYALCTAGDSIGKTMEILEKDLQARGLHLDAAYSLIMPESYVGLPFMDVDTKEREQEKLTKAEEDLEKITNNRHFPFTKNKELHRGPLPWLFSGPIGSFFVRHLVTDKPFHVDASRCIQCGYVLCTTYTVARE